ncbi:MAG: MoaD/ThiS family protein [Thermoplasmata archaeon]
MFFGPIRDATGARTAVVDGSCVREVVAATVARYGDELAALMPTCRVWLNGDPASPDARVGAQDEIALLPPDSGG